MTIEVPILWTDGAVSGYVVCTADTSTGEPVKDSVTAAGCIRGGLNLTITVDYYQSASATTSFRGGVVYLVDGTYRAYTRNVEEALGTHADISTGDIVSWTSYIGGVSTDLTIPIHKN